MIALTDGTGAVEERYAYSACGEPVFVGATGTELANSAQDSRYTYTGREWDEDLSLYHFRARMYDAESGRFLGRDPKGYSDGQDSYATYFVMGYTDPSGYRVDRGERKQWCMEQCKQRHPDPTRARIECELACGSLPKFPPDLELRPIDDPGFKDHPTTPPTGIPFPISCGGNIDIWGDKNMPGYKDYGCEAPHSEDFIGNRPYTRDLPDRSISQIVIRSSPMRCQYELKEACRVCRDGCVITLIGLCNAPQNDPFNSIPYILDQLRRGNCFGDRVVEYTNPPRVVDFTEDGSVRVCVVSIVLGPGNCN